MNKTFNIGDEVVCVEPRIFNYDNGGRGSGWKKDHQFTIARITSGNESFNPIAWPRIGSGVYFGALELVKDLRETIEH